MKRLLLGLVFIGTAAVTAEDKPFPERWVYVSRSLQRDSDVEDIRSIARTAAEHNLNGMVLTGLDRLDSPTPEYLARLEEVKKICVQHSLRIIPIIFSAGYGGGILRHNRNLAEGLPVENAPFVVKNGEARLEPDPAIAIANGGFEKHDANHATEFQMQDHPGEVSFIDTQVAHGGKASLRFEFEKFPNGPGRVSQQVAVKPFREYRLSVWLRTQDLGGSVRIQVRTADNRNLTPFEMPTPATTDWRKLTMGFNSARYHRVTISAGVSNGKGGKFWLDDLQLEEVGLVNILRRAGTPLRVKSAKTGTLYEEGRDYAAVSDPDLTFRFDHDGPPIRILPKSRITEGERLLVSYYHGMGIMRGQVNVCMSEPEVYEIWRKQAAAIHRNLHPAQYLLSMDEIRLGGSCEACKRQNMSLAKILGQCLTRQFEMIRDLNPKAEIYNWSDMLDPNHNARNNYYLVDGDYTGSWEYVPKDMRIVCWYFEKRRESLRHFSSLGFKTLAGAYYDADTLDNPKGWLETLKETPGALGIMYTTWRNKYALLPGFGDLLQ